jgi:hypothetical protein
MMSKEVLSLKSTSSPISPQSPRENVNHGGQEFKFQQNILLNDQDEDVANTWTKVLRDRTSRVNRQKVSEQSEKNFITPSPLGPVKGFSLSSAAEQKRSSFNKARSARFAKEEKSQKELTALKEQSNALQAQVVSLTSTLDDLMKVLKGMTGATPLVQHFPVISPLPKFSVDSPIKVSYAESVGSKSPSPSKTDSDVSTTSSSQVEPTHSPPRESAADGKHDGTAPSSPKSDGSPKGKFPTSPKRSPPPVAPATVDKREMSTPLPSTPSPTKAAATKPVSAKASKKEKKKGKASSSTPKSSPSSSDDNSHSDSTPDRKARRKARRKEIKAEKVTRALAANFQLIKLVTEKFPKLGNANYDSWQRAWTHQAKSLGYNTSYMSVDGPEWDVKTEDASQSVHRKNFAEMVIKTIDANEHEPWLRDTDRQNPQAIFRRMHLKFRGADTIVVSSQIESQLLMMTMKSTRLDVAAYGTAIVENLRKLSEMSVPMCEKKMVSLYLIGLNNRFDPIRFEIQKLIKNNKAKAPQTMATAKKMVEDWASLMKDRGFLTFKDTSGGEQKGTVLTLLHEVKKTGAVVTEACRGWLRSGTCKRLQDGTCKYAHETKKKGVNAPTPAVRAAAGAVAKDFTALKCNVCNITGHSHNWSKCPSKVAANKVLHVQPTAPTASVAPQASTSAKTPSIHPLQGEMTVSERALHGYNNKLLKILNVFATQANQQRGGAFTSSNPLMDPVAMMQAFSGVGDDD